MSSVSKRSSKSSSSSKNKPSSSSTSTSSSSSRTPTKRILTELSAFSSSQTQSPTSQLPPTSLIALEPLSSSNILSLRAILSGHLLPASSGYKDGRWLLKVEVPDTYPNAPPLISFVTRVCHPNVRWETGEVCLDVLGERWTPVLGVVGALESVGRLLGEPGTDSPLNVDAAALVRSGDFIGARGLVGFYCGEERFDGNLEDLGEEKGEKEKGKSKR